MNDMIKTGVACHTSSLHAAVCTKGIHLLLGWETVEELSLHAAYIKAADTSWKTTRQKKIYGYNK